MIGYHGVLSVGAAAARALLLLAVLSAAPGAAWAQQDPADSLYRAARENLNQGDYTRAAELFRSLPQRYPRSAYAPDAPYWEAFARYRIGGATQFQQALAVLEVQGTRYPNAATRADARALATRIQGELARLGDAEAALAVATQTTAGGSSRGSGSLPEGCSREDDEIRSAALNALLQSDTDRALPVLRQVLARRDPCSGPLRRTAVFLVSQKATPETEAVLLGVARGDPDIQVRKSAVFHLSQVGTDRALSILDEILRTPADSALQEQALFALSQHRDERARQALRAYATRADAPVRLRGTAIYWVGQDPAPENLAFLQNLYRQLQDDQLKQRILYSVSQRKDAADGRWLLAVVHDTTESIRTRTTALNHAGTSSNVTLQQLLALYDQLPDRKLKQQLTYVFTQRKEPAAFDKLVEIARKDPDATLRKQAIHWLAQSKDPRAAEVLLEIIGGT